MKKMNLTKTEKINLGSFYTPNYIVDKVHTLISKYITGVDCVVDFASGDGAFFNNLKHEKVFAFDIDKNAIESLKLKFNNVKAVEMNSLAFVKRTDFGLKDKDKIISVGNPPYNNLSSLNKKKIKKDVFFVNEALKSRDLGISFLKLYSELNCDVVCVLHPLSYLIKKTNFNLLNDFTRKYRLVKGYVFNSSIFESASKNGFPILIALYERNEYGTIYNDVLNFKFKVLNSDKIFTLNFFKTTDSIINKYPIKNKNDQYLNLFFQTFRDINSLKRNASFTLKESNSSIKFETKDFYKYCYLHAFKHFFKPNDLFLYGNLSPIYSTDIFSKENIKRFIVFSLNNSLILKQWADLNQEEYLGILHYYDISRSDLLNDNYLDLESTIMKLI
jgi:predicted RNA methylase